MEKSLAVEPVRRGGRVFYDGDAVARRGRDVVRAGAGEHVPGVCGCRRCSPLEHGQRAVVMLRGEVERIAGEIERELPVSHPRYRWAVEAAAVLVARSERALVWLEELEGRWEAGDLEFSEYMDRVRAAEEGWTRTIRALRGLLSDLGLTPRSEAEITRDLGLAADSGSRAAARLREHRPSGSSESSG